MIVRGSASVAQSRNTGSAWDGLRGLRRLQKRRDLNKKSRPVAPASNNEPHPHQPFVRTKTLIRWYRSSETVVARAMKRREEERRQCLCQWSINQRPRRHQSRIFYNSKKCICCWHLRYATERCILCVLWNIGRNAFAWQLRSRNSDRCERNVSKSCRIFMMLGRMLDNWIRFLSARDLFITTWSKSCQRYRNCVHTCKDSF